jgi:hypothetical protein
MRKTSGKLVLATFWLLSMPHRDPVINSLLQEQPESMRRHLKLMGGALPWSDMMITNWRSSTIQVWGPAVPSLLYPCL